jgi:hypothetical protein
MIELSFIFTVCLGFLITSGNFAKIMGRVSKIAFLGGFGYVAAQTALVIVFSYLPGGPWQAKPGFAAHRLLSVGTMAYVLFVASRTFLNPDAQLIASSATRFGRLEDAHTESEQLLQLILGTTFWWDVPCTFFLKPLRSPLRSSGQCMAVRLAAVVLLTWVTLAPCFQHYGMVFALLSVSSTPVALMDLCHPRSAYWLASAATERSAVERLGARARMAIALAFIGGWTVGVPYALGTRVVPDVIEVLVHPSPPISSVSLLLLLASSLCLVGLTTLHWAPLMWTAATAMAGRAKDT